MGNLGESALDLFEPGRMRWDNVQKEARVALEPAQDRWGFMRSLIVQHQIHPPDQLVRVLHSCRLSQRICYSDKFWMSDRLRQSGPSLRPAIALVYTVPISLKV
jgi:hypothetical protein